MNENKPDFDRVLAAAIPPTAHFETVLPLLLAARSDFHNSLAKMIEPSLNAFLRNAPQQTVEERTRLANTVMAGLKELGLSLRFPGTAEPASLRVDRGRGDNGSFELTMLDRNVGHRRMNCTGSITSAAFYPMELLSTPSRYASWTEKLKQSRLDAASSSPDPRRHWKRWGE